MISLLNQLFMKGLQPPYYQAVCFASKLSKQDFIAADAIAKLRQVKLPELCFDFVVKVPTN